MPRRTWLQPALIAGLSVLLTTVSLLALGIRAHDLRKLDWCVDEVIGLRADVTLLKGQMVANEHEHNRMRDRLERLEARK